MQAAKGAMLTGRETEEVASPIDRVAPAKGGKKRSLTATEALPQVLSSAHFLASPYLHSKVWPTPATNSLE